MADIFDSYQMAAAWDEMFERPGVPRPAYQSLFSTLQPLSGADLRFRADQLARVFTDRGVTFAYAGEERPFPLDLIPRIIDAAEWDQITRACDRLHLRRYGACLLQRGADDPDDPAPPGDPVQPGGGGAGRGRVDVA